MEVGIVLKVAGIGFLVAVACQVLGRTGRDEQAMLVSLAGVIIVLVLLTEEIGKLFQSITTIFGI